MILLVTFFLLFFPKTHEFNYETLKIRLNRPFFTFFSEYHVVDKEIAIPEIEYPFKGDGKGVVKTNYLKVRRFDTPEIDFNLTDSGMRWSTNGGSIELSGTWDAMENKVIRDKGWSIVNLNGIQMNISASMFELDGHLQIQIDECIVNIQKMEVEKFTEFELAANVVHGEHMCHPKNNANFTDTSSIPPGMVTSWISVSILNCLLDSAHKAGMFQYLTTTKKRPFEEWSIITMPLLFEEWMTTFSWDPVDILFHTLDAPFFEMSQNSQAQIIIDTLSKVEPYLKGTRIHGHLHNSTITVRLGHSNAGNIHKSKFDSLRRTSTEVAREVIGWILDVGMTIPLYQNVTVAESSYIQVFDDYLRIDVDFVHENKCS